MDKAKRASVQCLALKRYLEWRAGPRPINRVTDDRMANLSQVNANLVGAPRFEPASEERRRAAEFLDDFIMSDGAHALPRRAGDPSAAVPAINHEP